LTREWPGESLQDQVVTRTLYFNAWQIERLLAVPIAHQGESRADVSVGYRAAELKQCQDDHSRGNRSRKNLKSRYRQSSQVVFANREFI
jgi:hypothetical protein